MERFRAILMYHSIDEGRSPISLGPETFRRQMRSLFERGIPVVAPDRLLDDEGLEPGHPAVSLTFDDGFANFYTEAFPALSGYRFRATVFLAPGLLGEGATFQARELLSWSRIDELHRAGIEFGAHTVTHPFLTGLDERRAKAEILDSRRRIEDRIGAAVRSFAYPYGAESPSLRRLVGENFRIGCSTRLGYLTPASARESLERIDVHYLRDLFWFRRLFRRSTGAYLAGRAAVRGCRELLLGPA